MNPHYRINSIHQEMIMGIKAGLVGLPNVGKSTLFNALTKSSIPAENYPFCTIDPHMAITEVPDARLEKLPTYFGSQKTIPNTVSFVDIAGLVKGAATGEGLGNQFLSHIREVDLIIHVLRCFDDPNIVHTSASVDPLSDFEIIVAELILKDLESVNKRLERLPSYIKKTNDAQEKKALETEFLLLSDIQKTLDAGNNSEAKKIILKSTVPMIPLLSTKDFLIVANISEDEIANPAANLHYQALVAHFGPDYVIPVSAKIEGELSQLSAQDAQEMMEMLGITKPSLNTIISTTFERLGMITFFTCGPKEVHAWPIVKGITVRQAAGEIHSDLQKGFIAAEVYNCADLFALGSVAKVKELGKMRTEGQDYLVQDGDLLNIRFNV